MKKQKKFSDLSANEIASKQTELVKELVKFRVSMDTSHIQNPRGVEGLRKDLRVISRKRALSNQK